MSCYPPCKRKAIRNFLITRMFLPLNQAPSGDDGLKHRPEPQRACSLLLRLADRAIYLLKASPVRAAGGGKGAQRRATVLLQTTARPAREGGQQLRAPGSSSLTASLASPCPCRTWHLQHAPVSPGEEEPMQGTGRSNHRLCGLFARFALYSASCLLCHLSPRWVLCPGGSVLLHPRQG